MRELTDGATALVRGALDAGCDFFAGYPITPASAVLAMMLQELPKVGGTGIQAEDEIASIGMCIGATLGGARAMTATSGPGMSLYSENLGLAVMGEVPLVVIDVQRMGPATGGATTTAQGDVQFARWGTAGGYPLIVLAPASITDCYALVRIAFDWAERFRCPVVVLADKELATTVNTVDASAWEAPPVRPRVAAGGDGTARPYRFEPAEEVPPLAQFGSGASVRFTGSSHDEEAFITKDPSTVERLNRHLARKIEAHAADLELVEESLDAAASTLWMSYGITAGAMREAARRARAAGKPVSTLTLRGLWPVPEAAIRRAAEHVDEIVVAELNMGQYRREVERVTAGGCRVIGLERVDGGLVEPRRFLETLR